MLKTNTTTKQIHKADGNRDPGHAVAFAGYYCYPLETIFHQVIGPISSLKQFCQKLHRRWLQVKLPVSEVLVDHFIQQ